MPNLNLTPLQVMIVERLNYGAENAVTGMQLARLFGYKDDRVIREQIRILIGLKWAILASSGKHPGYYMAETKEEVEKYAENLHDRGVEILARRKYLLIAAKTLKNPHQMPLLAKGRV